MEVNLKSVMKEKKKKTFNLILNKNKPEYTLQLKTITPLGEICYPIPNTSTVEFLQIHGGETWRNISYQVT